MSYWSESGGLKEVYFSKADEVDPGRRTVEPVQINITGELPAFEDNREGWKDAKKHYQHDAVYLAECLVKSLPRGTLDRLLIELLKQNVSEFRGIAGA